MSVPREWLTRDEAAELLRRDVRTVDRYVRTGKLKKYLLGDTGGVLLRKSEVDALIRPVDPE